MFRIALRTLPTLALLALAIPAAAVAAPALRVRSLDARSDSAGAVRRAAEALAEGERLRLAGLADETGAPLTLELERAPVFAPDFQLFLDGEPAALDVDRFLILRGTVAEWPGSQVVLAQRPGSGAWEGALLRGESAWTIARTGESEERPFAELALVDSVEVESRAPWEPATDALHPGQDRSLAKLLSETGPHIAAAAATATDKALRTARISFDSDHEYFNLFDGDAAAATAFAGQLLAAISVLYEQQVGVGLTVGQVFLWTNAADPWEDLDPLFEVGTYWRQHRKHAQNPRAAVVFLSAKQTPYRGIAWLDGLCSKDFVISGGQYAGRTYGGYSVVRVRVGVVGTVLHTAAHELGHLFASPHTHCYSPPVDHCYAAETGCFSGPEEAPEDGGSIMSYCTNGVFSLGEPGKYGTASERVPDLIRGFVAALATVSSNNSDYFVNCLGLDLQLAVVVTGRTAVLTWADPLVGEQKWQVEQKLGNAAFRVVKTLKANATTVTLTNLKPGTYTFRVRAKLKKGFSPYSNTITVVITAS